MNSNHGGFDAVGGLLIAVTVAGFVFLVGMISGYQLGNSKGAALPRGETPAEICVKP